MGYGIKDAKKHMFNPVRSYPRNALCPCGSKKKFKKCCLTKQPMIVEKDERSIAAEKTIQVLRKVHKHRKAQAS